MCRSEEEADEVLKLTPIVQFIVAQNMTGAEQIANVIARSDEIQSIKLPTPFFYAVLFGRSKKSCIYLTW